MTLFFLIGNYYYWKLNFSNEEKLSANLIWRARKSFLEAEISSKGQSWILLLLAKSGGTSARGVELKWAVGEEKYRRRNGSFGMWEGWHMFAWTFLLHYWPGRLHSPFPRALSNSGHLFSFFLLPIWPNFSSERQMILQAFPTCNFLALVLVMTVWWLPQWNRHLKKIYPAMQMNILEKKKRMGSERNINEANTLKNSPASVVSRTALGMWSSEIQMHIW